MNIGIYLYDQVEVLDFAGPFEVFSTASRICSSGHPFTVFTVGETRLFPMKKWNHKENSDYH